MKSRFASGALVALLVMLSLIPAHQVAVADHNVEHRIAQFWARVDALQPTDHLSAADLGQWALNVIQRDARARISVVDFRRSTAGMQEAMDRAGLAPTVPAGAPAPGPTVEQRVAEFWKRVDALGPHDHLAAADLGQWALNVIERNARARISVADFRLSTAGMQGAMDHAARFSYQVGPGVSDFEFEHRKRGLGIADAYIAAAFGDPIFRPLPVVLNASVTETPQLRYDRFVCGTGSREKMFFEQNFSCAQPHMQADELGNWRAKGGVHEFVHTWQDTLGCIITPDYRTRRSPAWFMEGMAENLAWRAMLGNGYSQAGLDRHAAYNASQAKQNRDKLRLADVDTNQFTVEQGQYIYYLSYTAVRLLIERSGLVPFRTYCLSVGRGTPWQTAFAATYGMTKDAFYAEVDRFLDTVP